MKRIQTAADTLRAPPVPRGKQLRTRVISFGASVLLACILATGHSASATAEILIGLAVPIQGPKVAVGRDIRRGAELAVAQINDSGGLLGERVSIVSADDGCADDKAEAAARTLVARGVALVVGHPCARAAIAAAKIYAEAGVVFIAPATRHPALTDQRAGPTVFRLSGRDDHQGSSAGAYLARAFATRPVAVVHDGSRYAERIADDALAALKAGGATDVLTATVKGGQKDYAALIDKLKNARTEALFFAGLPMEGALLLRQIRAAGLKTTFLGSDALAAPPFAATAGDAAKGAGALLPYDAARTLSADVLGERLPSQTPTGSLVSALAAVEAWSAAVRRVRSIQGALVGRALERGIFETVLGPLTFNDKGDGDVRSYDVVWWNGGMWSARN